MVSPCWQALLAHGRRNLLLYFEREDIDAAFAGIPRHMDLSHPVTRRAWGERVFRFYDPDDHTVEFGELQNSNLRAIRRRYDIFWRPHRKKRRAGKTFYTALEPVQTQNRYALLLKLA